MPASRARARTKARGWRGLKIRLRVPKARWKRAVLAVMAGVAAFAFGVLAFYYVQFSRIIEARLHGERDRVIPKVFARPLTLRTGQGLSGARPFRSPMCRAAISSSSRSRQRMRRSWERLLFILVQTSSTIPAIQTAGLNSFGRLKRQ